MTTHLEKIYGVYTSDKLVNGKLLHTLIGPFKNIKEAIKWTSENENRYFICSEKDMRNLIGEDDFNRQLDSAYCWLEMWRGNCE